MDVVKSWWFPIVVLAFMLLVVVPVAAWIAAVSWRGPTCHHGEQGGRS